MHQFAGKWITNRDFAALTPLNLYHRQLDKREIDSKGRQDAHILFRSRFESSGGKTVVYISADDYYKLYINGAFVCQGPAPGYPEHYYYNTVDITPYVRKGTNTVAVHTYYQGLINRVWVSGDDRQGLILDVEEDGKTVLASDESFKTSYHAGFDSMGQYGYKTQFAQIYTSGTESEGFRLPDYDDSSWCPAALRKNADWKLFAQPTEMLVFERIAPTELRQEGNRVFADFGAMYVGYLSAEAQGPEGEAVTLYFGQELNDDGSVRWHLRANCDYISKWVLSGRQDRLNEYDYKAFRYAELLLPPGTVLSNVKLIARHYPFALAVKPKTTDKDLLSVWELCVRSLRYGNQEVIHDCMERERGNYLGDGCYTALTYLYLTKDPSVFEKLIDDTLRSSFINRGLVTCAACSFMQEVAEYPLMMFHALEKYIQLTGNTAFVNDRFEQLQDVLDYYRETYENSDGLLTNLDKWCVVEWPKNYRDDYDAFIKEGTVCTDIHNVINAHYAGAVLAFNRICELLHRPQYRDGQALKNAYICAFYDTEAGFFRDRIGSDHVSLLSNTFPLMYGLCPNAACEERIVELIRQRGITTTMIFGSYPILEGLRRLGRQKDVYEMLADKGAWLRMLREGATATFEGWAKDAKWNTSLFHLTLSYAALFFEAE